MGLAAEHGYLKYLVALYRCMAGCFGLSARTTKALLVSKNLRMGRRPWLIFLHQGAAARGDACLATSRLAVNLSS